MLTPLSEHLRVSNYTKEFYVWSFVVKEWSFAVLCHISARGPFQKQRLNLISAWISNHIGYKVWDKIRPTYPFPNFNSCAVEVCERMSNFYPYLTGHMIIYPRWGDCPFDCATLHWHDSRAVKDTAGVARAIFIPARIFKSIHVSKRGPGR